MPRKPTGQPPGRRPQRGAKATRLVKAKVTPDEYERIEYDARLAGMTVSEYVRSKCLPNHWDHIDGTEEM